MLFGFDINYLNTLDINLKIIVLNHIIPSTDHHSGKLMNIMWMTSDNEKATIHNVQEGTSVSALVSSFLGLSVRIESCNTVSSISFFYRKKTK